MSAIVLCFGNDVPHIGPRVRSAFSSKWMAQQARNLLMKLDDRQRAFRFLIHDRDSKFTGDVDTIFRSEGIEIIRTPVQAPNAKTLVSHCTSWA